MLILLLLFALCANVSAEVTYETFDIPFEGAGFTVITGVIPGAKAGAYVDSFGNNHSWIKQGRKEVVPLLGITIQDMSLAGATGYYRAPVATSEGQIFTWSFIYNEGNFQVLQGPRIDRKFSTLVEAISMNDFGHVCGSYRNPLDGKFYAFLYIAAQYQTFDIPGSLSTTCLALSNEPTPRLLLLAAVGGQVKYYLWEFGSLTELNIPDFPNANIATFHQHHIAGNIGNVGFLYDGTIVQEIEAPNSRLTDVEGLLVSGNEVKVYGRYIGNDEVHHGFIATIAQGAMRRIARVSTKTTARIAMTDCSDNSKRHECIQARRER